MFGGGGGGGRYSKEIDSSAAEVTVTSVCSGIGVSETVGLVVILEFDAVFSTERESLFANDSFWEI